MYNAEIRLGWRNVAKQPAQSLLIALILALGLASVIAVLSILKSLVWDALPFANADSVLAVGLRDLSTADDDLQPIPGSELLRWKELLAGHAQVAGVQSGTLNLQWADTVERFDGAQVTANLFDVLGVAPVLGRGFREEDAKPGASMVILISEELWRTRFNAEPSILGTVVRANSKQATVIGVMPARFAFPDHEQIWAPAPLSSDISADADVSLETFVLPARGVADSTVLTQLRTWLLDARVRSPIRWDQAELDSEALSYRYSSAQVRELLYLMLLCVTMVLLVACANAASLMLARTLARSRDLALRLSLGASRWQIARQLFTEILMLTLFGLLLAVPLAHCAIEWVLASFIGTEDRPPPWIDFGLDAAVAAMAIAVALVSAVIVALVPILRIRVEALASVLRDGGRGVTGGLGGRFSAMLVSAQIALACIVLLSTLVIVRGVGALERTDLGINPQGLFTARIALFPESYPEDAQLVEFFRDLSMRLNALPGVLHAGAGTTLPGFMGAQERVVPEGGDFAPDDPPEVRYASIDQGFIPSYGIELRSGRNFDQRDAATSQPVAIIDQRFADTMFAGADPLNRRVRFPATGDQFQWYSVVGVVENLQLEDVGDPELPTLLLPLSQHPERFVSMVVRTRGDPAAFKARFLETLRAQDPATPAYWLRTYDEVLRNAMVGERVLSGMFSAFGLVALILVAAGLYGLIAQRVVQCTREIGVQRALGAGALAVLHGLLRKTLSQISAGLLIGLTLALPFAYWIAQVANVPGLALQREAVPLLVLILMVIALLATLMPARRALAIDPTIALRHE